MCAGCSERDHCTEVYKKLGQSKSESVLLKVIIAFLLPMIVFILSLVIFDKIFDAFLSGDGLKSWVTFLSSLVVTGIYVMVVKLAGGKLFGEL